MPTFAERAAALVETAREFANASHDWPALHRLLHQDIEPDRWVFIMTVGGAFIAMQLIFLTGASDDEGSEAVHELYEALEAWDPDGRAAYTDCQRFFNDAFDSLKDTDEYRAKQGFLIADGVGSWVVWNVLRRAPRDDDEIMAARVVGTALFNAFSSYWGVDLGTIGKGPPYPHKRT
jgi:hypothetical protein